MNFIEFDIQFPKVLQGRLQPSHPNAFWLNKLCVCRLDSALGERYFLIFSTSLTILYADGVSDTCTHLPHVPVPCLSHYNLNSRLTDFPKTWLELHHSTLTSRTLFQNNNAVTTINLLLCCAVLCWWDPPDKLRVVYIFGWKKKRAAFCRAQLWRRMPQTEMMNASRQTHNESDIPEIRVKTAYNGQVDLIGSYLNYKLWKCFIFDKNQVECDRFPFLFQSYILGVHNLHRPRDELHQPYEGDEGALRLYARTGTRPGIQPDQEYMK